MFFLSSPTPAPQRYPEHQPHSSPFFPSAATPHKTWTTSYENNHAQAYSKSFYAPHSPSPLRTARNANLMSSPTRSTGTKSSFLSSSPLRGGFEEDAENWCANGNELDTARQATGFGFQSKIHATPMGTLSPSMGGYGFDGEGSSNLITPPDSGPQTQTQANRGHPDALSSPVTPSTNFSPHRASASQSQWSLRSRASSPSSQLATHTTRNREERKSRFLDRIRRRRDDERSDGIGEQVLRMDFVRERKGWEEVMAKKAAIEVGDGDEEEGDDDEVVDEELSPTEEYEYEYDDFVRQSEDPLKSQGHAAEAKQEDDFLVDDNDGDDEEYERLFREMEILSQRSQPLSQTQAQTQQPSQQIVQGRHRGDVTAGQHQHQHQQLDSGNDQMMDLS